MKYMLLILAALALVGVAYADNCTQGWKCENSTTLNYQYVDCSWGENPYPCEYGCNLTTNQCNPCPEMGICGSGNESICDGGWYTEWQTQYCTLINTTCCPYGCSNGECNNTPPCSEGWICEDAYAKIYQNADCSLINSTDCQYGCSNGECAPPPCATGWVCSDSTHRAYQTQDCSLINSTYCQFGCRAGACSAAPSPVPTPSRTKIKANTAAAVGGMGINALPAGVVLALGVAVITYGFLRREY